MVIGGGAAGFFGAIAAKTPHNRVTIVEQGRQPLEKVRISGGGRCNVTTSVTEPVELAGHYPRGHRELRGAFFRVFGSEDVREWFELRGVPLKVEPDGRVFPVSDSSESVIACLRREAADLGIELLTQTNATKVVSSPLGAAGEEAAAAGARGFEVSLKRQPGGSAESEKETVLAASHLLLATGSDRVGWRLARALGHAVVEPRPSLFSFKCPDAQLTQLQGLSLQRATATLVTPASDAQRKGKGGGGSGSKGARSSLSRHKSAQPAPVLITHWGLSGPLVLKLSAWAARDLAESKYALPPHTHTHTDTLSLSPCSNFSPSHRITSTDSPHREGGEIRKRAKKAAKWRKNANDAAQTNRNWNDQWADGWCVFASFPAGTAPPFGWTCAATWRLATWRRSCCS